MGAREGAAAAEELRSRRRRRRSFSDEIWRRGAAAAADEEDDEEEEGLGFCFCFEAGCFFFGAIWPRAPGVLALPSDRLRRRRAFGTSESRGTAACWV